MTDPKGEAFEKLSLAQEIKRLKGEVETAKRCYRMLSIERDVLSDTTMRLKVENACLRLELEKAVELIEWFADRHPTREGDGLQKYQEAVSFLQSQKGWENVPNG
jgi:hypothetical protein